MYPHMSDAHLFSLRKSFNEISSHPGIARQDRIFHDDDVTNRENLRTQIICSFDLAKIRPQAANSRGMASELRIYLRQHAGVDFTAQQCLLYFLTLW